MRGDVKDTAGLSPERMHAHTHAHTPTRTRGREGSRERGWEGDEGGARRPHPPIRLRQAAVAAVAAAAAAAVAAVVLGRGGDQGELPLDDARDVGRLRRRRRRRRRRRDLLLAARSDADAGAIRSILGTFRACVPFPDRRRGIVILAILH